MHRRAGMPCRTTWTKASLASPQDCHRCISNRGTKAGPSVSLMATRSLIPPSMAHGNSSARSASEARVRMFGGAWDHGGKQQLNESDSWGIKRPDNPTCQLLPVSSNRTVKTGWERQKRERRSWKTDRVREFCVRRLCVCEKVYTMHLKKYV